MGVGKRSREVMLDIRAKIAKLAVFGNPSQQKIAERLGLDQSTVSRHLKALRKEWRESAQADIEDIIAQELQKLDALEAEAVAEWERSKKDWEKRKIEEAPAAARAKDNTGKPVRKVNIETGGQCGDPRYLQVILGIQDRRAKLLGTDKPSKVAPTTPDGKDPYKPMTDAELDGRILELTKKLGPEAAQANGSS